MFPGPTELLLLVIRSNQFGPKNPISNTLTPKTNSQTYWPREISHVMNGIIFCVCQTLAISVLQSVLKWCRNEHKKIQVKKESQQNQSRWWIWSRDAGKGLQSCFLLLHQKVLGKPDTKVKLLWVRTLRSTIHSSSHAEWNIDKIFLKSGNLMNWWTIGRETVVSAQHTDQFIIENDLTNS